jgi:anhydro-N-acetylmuramic acid kinase
MKVIGLMSGTSADGVDAAVVDIHGRGHNLVIKPLAFRTYSYPSSFRTRLLAAIANGAVGDLCHMNAALGEWFARAALAVLGPAGLSPRQIGLIGSHGQTFHHQPNPIVEKGLGPLRSTFQLGSAGVIAQRTGITTIADFRTPDMAAGGQGAPLTPYFHYLLFRHRSLTRAVVNIGGISNVTYLPAKSPRSAVRAFDSGPGNMVIDGLVRHLTKGKCMFDKDGEWAQKGSIHGGLLRGLLRHPYLQQRPPKSTGREEFGDAFLQQLLRLARRPGLSKADLVATATAFTAHSISEATAYFPRTVNEILVCGGGAKNRTLMQMLQAVCGDIPVRPVNALGWDPRALEAMAFAVLAYQTTRGVPCNLPKVTGAKREVLLGIIAPAALNHRVRRPPSRSGTQTGRLPRNAGR